MDVNTFIQIVNGVGFPIAACIAMAVFIVWERKTNIQKNKEIFAKNETALAAVQKSIENNTEVLKRLCEKLDMKEVL